MKVLILVSALLLFSFGYSQTNPQIRRENEASLSLKVSVNSVQQLKAIDWRVIEDTFNNEKPNNLVAFIINVHLLKSKNNLKYTLQAKGKAKNHKKIIQRIKKATQKLISQIKNNSK